MLGDVVPRRRELDVTSPFYALPSRRQTSAEIIREARTALNRRNEREIGVGIARIGVKTVNTKRPFTPKEKERTLFGTVPARDERPPSSFTLSPLHFDSSEVSVRCNTGSACNNGFKGKLLPILTVSANGVETLPQSGHRKLVKSHFRNAQSLCDLPEEGEEETKNKNLFIRSSTLNNDALDNGMGNSVIMSPAYQKMSQENDLLITSFDSSKSDLFQNSSINSRKPSTPEAPQVKLSKEDLLAMKSPEVTANIGSDGESFRIFSSKRRSDLSKGDAAIPEHTRPMKKSTLMDHSVFYEDKISPILDEIDRAISCGIEDVILSELVNKLYVTLQNWDMLRRQFKYRSNVLRTIFKLVDREHGKLLVNVARLMLALKVSGNNLTSVCKLVFKVTRHDTNDVLFMDGNLLELLLDAVACSAPLEQAEACIYGYGALKFLTMNSQLIARLLNRGILELIVLHMKLIINEKEEKKRIPEQTGYALVQLTATLRHVSSCDKAFPLLLGTGAVNQVCKLLHKFYEDSEVTANVVRVLSIMSTQDECCTAAAEDCETLVAAVRAIELHCHLPAIVVRLAYALGNMMAYSDHSRWQLFCVDGFTETVFALLKKYLLKNREEQADSFADTLLTVSSSSEDVIVKLIRILANVSVHQEVGSFLANSQTCLDILVSVVRRSSVEENEELILSALATLNNLTFYTRSQKPTKLHLELTECLCETLPMEHLDALIEAIRVFGNLTHSKEVRDILVKKEVLEILIEMLDCNSRELVFVCAGVLVNMMSDLPNRSVFQQESAPIRMNDVLQYFGYGDWQLCSLCCQVLWNYCASAENLEDVLDEKETGRLTCILEEFLDEESFFNNPEVMPSLDTDIKDVAHTLWEDFASVALKLLERIEEDQTRSPGSSSENLRSS